MGHFPWLWVITRGYIYNIHPCGDASTSIGIEGPHCCKECTLAHPPAPRFIWHATRLDVPEAIFDFGAVTTMVWTAPCHYRSICQDCSKSTVCATNLLNMPKLILDSGAVTTTVLSAPCHHALICQSGTESQVCATDLPDIRELLLHSGAVTTMV